MDKYCTFIVKIKAHPNRFGRHRICGDAAAAPHPLLPNATLCIKHRDGLKRLIKEFTKAYG